MVGLKIKYKEIIIIIIIAAASGPRVWHSLSSNLQQTI